MQNKALLLLVAGFFLLSVAACNLNDTAPAPAEPTTFFSTVAPSGAWTPVALVAQASPAAAPTEAPTEGPTPEPAGADIARPSNKGGPGPAVALVGSVEAGKAIFAQNCERCHAAEGKGGISNPGSDDGTVPPLNPIDSTLVSSDYKTFATNLDLFIEHGSTPSGTGPVLSMPDWGDSGKLKPQQIADVIAYVISLNK